MTEKHAEIQSRFEIVENRPDRICIRDLGPWDQYKTVTNDAENVVAVLFQRRAIKPGKRLFYYDSDQQLDEILFDSSGKFTGFAPGPRE